MLLPKFPKIPEVGERQRAISRRLRSVTGPDHGPGVWLSGILWGSSKLEGSPVRSTAEKTKPNAIPLKHKFKVSIYKPPIKKNNIFLKKKAEDKITRKFY